MADHMDNGLIASIKALDDVVAKSIDASNPLAREQLMLVSRYLGFVRQRAPFQFERDRFELEHYIALGKALARFSAIGLADGAPSVASAVRSGQTVLEQVRPTTAQVRAAIDALTTAISVLVRCVANADPDLRRSVERTVTAASGRLFDLQRAWYLPMGFEPDPNLVPTLEQALAAAPASVPIHPQETNS
jgi:hypothetical protein